jgi:mono/diheme cytochrome c family protein
MAKKRMNRTIVLLAAGTLLFSPLARAEPGHQDRGRALFVGSVPFENGGAPCLACHGFAGLGPGGGANFGGDLTAIYENFGEDGVVSILEDLSFPGMEPIFADRPLTDTERADLAAFFRSSPGGASPDVQGALGLGGLAVAGAGLILAGLAGRGRLREVRRSLVENKRQSNQR